MRPFLLLLTVLPVLIISGALVAQDENEPAPQELSAQAGEVVGKSPSDKSLRANQTAQLNDEIAALEKKLLLLENQRIAEAQLGEEKQNRLRWQVAILGAALVALLVMLAVQKFYRKRRIRILAMTDDLTKLPNRRHILTFLGDQAKLAYEEEQPLSVIAFDIDHFKVINDKFGHDLGDIALKAVADVANQALRRGDRVGRIGGEKFLVVLPGSTRKSAADIAERLRCSIEVTEVGKLPPGFKMTISLGVCEWNAGHESIEALLKRADKALYEAKNAGRNRVVEI